MLVENTRLALKDFGANKTRAFLSILGIVIGIGSVIAIATIGQSATRSVQDQVAQGGLQTIMVFPGRGSSKEVQRLFTVELAAELEARIEGVEHVMPFAQGAFAQGAFDLRAGRSSYDRAAVLAVDHRLAGIFSYDPARGSFFSAEDGSGRRSVAVLGAEIATALFPDGDALGRYVRIHRQDVARSFRVVGVMAAKTATMGLDFDASVYVPYQTYSSRLERLDSVGRYAIGTGAEADVLAVGRQVEEFFQALTGNQESYRVVSPATMARMFAGITETLNLFLTGVAAISLLVGGIGIMNIMLVSVTERTREIGIRKALGAAPRVIRGQFLTEAVTLTLFGGILGIALGTGLSLLATSLLGWSFAPRASAYVLAVAFASAVGVFFGLYPAVRAARLDPVAALAFE